ncbi:hypothetical protein DSCO28_42190 [Desulfosarcina ovata subsp. sediminis]|uniref:PKD/Chitinase domain-containing protein n=1 Tax=Desulfosarcina ovata subsp. sediminis TaxID=885957 RepID=A0A5K7ZTW0_9BACT|nr:PKD domain-containing protein [Desulfosarcina ovata]BBO83653.1 hypothetical protein DSCO28_42190 [Desulfosarcina ovata subsp. sediminis]
MRIIVIVLSLLIGSISMIDPVRAESTYATSVVDYDAYFMNWDGTNGFYHNPVDAYPDAGADLDWLLGGVDETVAAGWGGDAEGGTLTLYYDTAFTADGTDAADIVVHGFGFAYNTPFSTEKGAMRVFASADGENWTVISDYVGYDNGDTWEANPDFTESNPGVPSVIMEIDLDDDISNTYAGPISYLKFELGDGETGHGRAFFTSAIEGVTAYQASTAPTADAGADQTVDEGEAVTLDGSDSSDPDGDALSYQWVQTDSSGYDVSLSDATSATASFTAPEVAADGAVLIFQLTVTDSGGLDATDTVRISIVSENQSPTADASDDQTVGEGTLVSLDGSGSSDPDGDALSYQWVQTDSSGYDVSLSDATSATASFTAPEVAADGAVLIFQLTVTDSGGLDATDTVRVSIVSENQSPTADASADQTVGEGTLVSLDGSGSSDPDGDALSYQWVQTDSSGYDVSLSDATSATASFTAPEVAADGAVLIFQLTVTDSGGLDATDTVRVSIVSENQSPTADASADQTVGEGTLVSLDGSGSSDPDGDALSYQWVQTDSSGVSVSLSDADTATPSFTAPDVAADGASLTFELTVTDTCDLADTDTVIINIEFVNQSPTADAGADQTVDEGEAVTLDGSGSSDPDGDALSYQWVQTDSSGYDVSLSDATSAKASFTAPEVAAASAVLIFQLTVTDSGGLDATDTVRVSIVSENQSPTADAGADQTVDEGEAVTLDGSGSSDPDGDALSYQWVQTDSSGVSVSLSDADTATPSFTAPDVAAGEASLTFELTVTDTCDLADTDTVIINIEFVNQSPTADAGDGQTVTEGDTVSLDGSGSSDPDGDTLSYQWVQADSSGYNVSLSNADSAAPSFTAPDVDADSASLTFTLTVTDTGGLSGTASVIITVGDADTSSDSVFATAVIDYGAYPASVPDDGIFMNWDNTEGFYHNEVTAYPDAGANLDWLLGEVDESQAAGWGGDANGGYLILYFDTAFTADGTDAADIVVYGFGYAYNTPFTSEKGAITVSVSADGENWTVVSDYEGYANGDVWEANPDFTESSPGVQSVIMQIDLDDAISHTYDGAISYLRFELGDGTEGHGRAFFVNAVEGGEMNVAPMAEAGISQEVDPGAEVTLDGTGSEDIDDGIATYAWTQVEASAAITVILDDATSPAPTFTAPDAPGESLTFELTVTDYAGQSDTDTVAITIIKASDITDYYATGVAEESGCISWEEQAADGGENALGLPDYVPDSEGDCSGWDSGTGYLVVKFNNPLEDTDGLDDLAIAHCGTGETEILASADGQAWTSLGTLPAGSDACEEVAYTAYDFSDADIDDVQYIKIEKTGSSARFIDAVFVPVRVYGATAEDTDDEYPDGCVDWVAKQADDGENALGEPDYDDSTAGIGNCSGWMVEAGRITIGFDKPFFDGQGDDLNVYHFGRGGANVQASTDGLEWISLGELPAGINGGSQLDTAGYDLADAGITWIQYVRINKTQVGYTYGRFIDAVEGIYGIPGATGAAGRDQTVTEGTAVTLGADADDDDSESVAYTWKQTGGLSVALSDDNAKNPQFIAPMIDGGKTELRFTVARTEDSTETEDEVRIVVVDNGMTLSATEEDHFSEAEIVFNNDVGADNLDWTACNMGLSCEGGSVVFYEAQDPDSTLSSDYIDDFEDRPKNILYGLLAVDVKTDVIGGTAVVSVFLPEAAGSDYCWYKYSEDLGWIDFSRNALSDDSDNGAEFNADRTVVTLTLTDGGPYDDDGLANGIVKDPSGLADATTVNAWHDEGGGGCFIGTALPQSKY